jgi:hypothetical protein
MRKINECIETAAVRMTFVKTEKGKSFTLVSNSDIDCKIIAVDKCVFQNEPVKRCDFLFVVPKSKEINVQIKSAMAYYVELKGDDLKKVCEQISNAIERTKGELLNYRIEARVVATKGFQPNLITNNFFRKVKKMIGKEILFCKVHKGNHFNHNEILT